MVVHHNIHPEPIQAVSRRELWPIRFPGNLCQSVSRHDNRGFRSPGARRARHNRDHRSITRQKLYNTLYCSCTREEKPVAQEQSRTENLLTLTASVGCFTLRTGTTSLADFAPASATACQRYFSKIQCLRHVATRPKLRKLPTMSALLSLLEVPCDLGTEVQNRLCQHMQDAETEGNLAHIHATEHELRIGKRGLRETDASQRKSKMNCANQGKGKRNYLRQGCFNQTNVKDNSAPWKVRATLTDVLYDTRALQPI